jgi:outer membrane protein
VLIILMCTGGTALAQAPTNPDSALHSIIKAMKGTPLALQQAIQYGLKNATSVRRAEAVYMAAAGAVRRESGVFYPQLFFNLNYLDQKIPTASFFAGAPVLATQQTTSQSGLRLDLPIGTQLELSLNTTKLNTNSSFAFLSPEYDAFGTLSLRQPLLGGFAASARKQLTRSERELDAEKARYDQQVVAISTEVERMYWDLYAAERNYAVQILSRDRAQAFLKETELRAKAGLVGPNEVANAKTFLAEQELQVLDRGESLDQQSDLLSSLIGERPGSEMPRLRAETPHSGVQVRFITVDSPPSDFPLEDVDQLVERAVKNNLDLQAAHQDVEGARALADAAGWEALPNVNLVGSIGGSGLGGTNQPVVFNNDTLLLTRSGSFSDALTQVGKRDFPNWSVGLEVNIPIGLRSGLGEKDRLEAQVLNTEQQEIELSRALENQVRSTYRELAHGKDRLKAAGDGVAAAQEQVRIGLIEFRNGRSTAFELVRLGEDFAVAQQRYSEALVRTAKAAATLRLLTSGGYPTPKNE